MSNEDKMKQLKKSLLPFAALAMMTSTANASLTFYDNQAIFDGLVATTLVDDYETGGSRDTALPSLTRNGVTYTPLAGVPFHNVWLASPGYNNFGAGVGVTTTSILTANGDERFTAVFANPVEAASFDAYRNGLGVSTVSVFNNSTLRPYGCARSVSGLAAGFWSVGIGWRRPQAQSSLSK
ncbi:MAG: hypothetical protein FD130_1845 [Halothiobacillaceae bacterium]|nr:MAG: hypothetical protein FD130_1845 [Halothiobacillaceae bacterium]